MIHLHNKMEIIATFVLLSVWNVVANAQLQENPGYWKEHPSTLNYYPNDTLNLVTLGAINGKKYLFANQEASWFEASYFCNAHGMDLVSIETQRENDLIIEHISKIGLTDTLFWTSGHNIGTSSWIWINGDFIIFSDWSVNEPNSPVRDHCIYIQKGKWYNGYCAWRGDTWTQGFICEEREIFAESESQQRIVYPTDLLNLVTLDPTTGKEYLFANVSAQWFEASYFCNAHGMDLVTIETQKENDLIMAHIDSLGMTLTMVYWTSGHKIERSTWLWINGDNVIFSDWAAGEPHDPATDHCIHIWAGNWYDIYCRWIDIDQAAFICESREMPLINNTEVTSYYPADMMTLVTIGPGAGKKYLFANQQATWFEASYFCNAHGMDLVIIETQEENDAIMNQLLSLGFETLHTLTSGHKIGRATYLWINGEYMLYADWAPGEPSQQATENCMVILRSDWSDLPGNYTAAHFICEERIPMNVNINKLTNE